MSGKKKEPGRQYHQDWGGVRQPSVRRKKPLIATETLKGVDVILIRRIGEGDFTRGLEAVLKDWRHF